MKFIGIASSPRRGKSSRFLLERCFSAMKTAAEEQGQDITIEIVDLAKMKFAGCISCDFCKKGLQCSQKDDFQPMLEKLADPELAGILVSTPVYMGSMTSQAKAFLDRTVAHRRNGFMLRNKLGGVITVGGSRNGGQELTIQGVHAAMMIHDMIIVGDGDHFGGIAWGNHSGGYESDLVGVASAEKLGQRLAQVALKIHV